MKNEEAIRRIKEFGLYHAIGDLPHSTKTVEAFNMAIEALKQPSNETQLLDDGTLKVKVVDVLDIKRVMIMDNNVIYDAYYPDRPKGEWIKATGMMPPEFHGHHYCSECGNFANMEPPFGNREDLSDFCPNCGADMRGGTE